MQGSCLCGAVSYEITGELGGAVACHCTQCRKQSGHVWASVRVPDGQLTVSGEDKVKWFTSSEWAKRGFCRECGSVLFWRMEADKGTAVAAGTLDKPTGLSLTKHIYVADKGDYYDIADGLPQLDTH